MQYKLPSNLPYGLMIKNINYLGQFDFSELKNHAIFIELIEDYYEDKKIFLSSLEIIKEIGKKFHIDFYFYYASSFNNCYNKNEEVIDEFKKLVHYIYVEFAYIDLWNLQEFSFSELYKEIVVNDTESEKQKEIQQKSLSSAFSLAKDV